MLLLEIFLCQGTNRPNQAKKVPVLIFLTDAAQSGTNRHHQGGLTSQPIFQYKRKPGPLCGSEVLLMLYY